MSSFSILVPINFSHKNDFQDALLIRAVINVRIVEGRCCHHREKERERERERERKRERGRERERGRG